MAAHQFVRIVQLRSRQQIQAGGIHKNPGCPALDYQIVRLGSFIQLEFVLEPAAPARENGDAQGCLPAFRGNNLGYAGSGTVRDAEAG